MKAVILAGGLGSRISEETDVQAEADDRDRRPADPLAHHEDLLRTRRQRLRHLPRLQGLRDQGVLRELLPAHVRRDVRPRPTTRSRFTRTRRAVARDAGRHRRRHDDRRPPEARARTTSPTSRSASPTATASPTSTSARWSTSTAPRETLATVTAVQPPGRFGALEIEGRPRARLPREARRATAAGSTAASSCCRPRSRDYIDGDATVWEREPLERLAARRPAVGLRSTTASGSRWTRCATRTSFEELWDSGDAPWKVGRRRRRSGAAGASSSPATPASRAAGCRSGSPRWAPRSPASGLRRRATPSLFELAPIDELRRDASAPTSATPTPWRAAVAQLRPEVVFHLAAQPLVRPSFRRPGRRPTRPT